MSEQITETKDPFKTIALVAYGCFVLGLFLGGFPSLVGVIIAYMKRQETEGTIYQEHFRYLIKTFWVGLIGAVLGTLTLFFGIGLIILVVFSIWYAIRVVYGLVKVLDKKSVNSASWLV
ncbi:hypothetical protein GNY91_09815 [Glaesserella parasuis]|uniref:DUF4870 family protein n=1 Tax=Glaesserella parasuis TaxID=738 RepID=UPI0013282068|nr:hypothetical protein [Glaesserella parasuis]MDG6247742.1 hypothetical protein [Glaesserella parasuis]MXP17614.1 hypothetical protein [Glaesserella parasuis]